MTRPSFIEAVAVALVASVLGGGACLLLSALVGPADALRITIALVGLGYLLWLLRRARARTGRLCVLALWLAATAATWLLDPAPVAHLLMQLAIALIARAIWFHRGVLAVLADLGLCVASVAAAAWAVHQSASLALAIWCLMLVQAGFVAIPQAIAPERVDEHAEADPFERAHHAAESAVRRLSAIR